MKTRGTLGELEQLTLLAVARLEGGEAYGARIRRELEETGHRSVSIATVYVALVRLEKKRYLRSRMGAPTATRGGKAKRIYRLTKAGERALREARDALDRMWHGLEKSAWASRT